jgi:hypothetical protein
MEGEEGIHVHIKYMQRFFSAFSGGLIRDGTIRTSGEHYSMASVS